MAIQILQTLTQHVGGEFSPQRLVLSALVTLYPLYNLFVKYQDGPPVFITLFN